MSNLHRPLVCTANFNFDLQCFEIGPVDSFKAVENKGTDHTVGCLCSHMT